jgi:hypothetical protein
MASSAYNFGDISIVNFVGDSQTLCFYFRSKRYKWQQKEAVSKVRDSLFLFGKVMEKVFV